MNAHHQLSLIKLPPADDPKEERRQKRWKPKLNEVKLSDLPDVYREVAEYIGMVPALKLIKWRGGSILTVPLKERPNHPLNHVINTRDLRLLCGRYGATRINLPTIEKATIPARNRAIRDEYDSGATVRQLVCRFSLSERTIHSILNTGV